MSRSMLPMANTVSWLGGGTAALVALSLCAIVQQALLHPQPRQRTAAAPVPVAVRKTPSRTRRPVAVVRLESSVRTVLKRSALARDVFGTRALGQPNVVLSRIDRAKGWAFGSSAVQPAAGDAGLPYAALFVAREAGSGWQVALAGTKSFSSLLDKAPASVVPHAELAALLKYGAAAQPAETAATGLALPWKTGESWTLKAASGTGLRFGGGDGRVVAPGDGRVYRVCGMLLLVHPNGVATEYSQLTGGPSLKDGTLVRQGTFLGEVAANPTCGGSPPAGTLAFGLLCEGRPMPVDGLQIGGWTLHAPKSAAPFADRAGVRVGAGEPLLNFGTAAPLPSPSPSSSPSPLVSPGVTLPLPSPKDGVL